MKLAQLLALPLLIAFTVFDIIAAAGLAWSAQLAVQSHDTLPAAGSLWMSIAFATAGWLCGGLAVRVFGDMVS